MARRENRLHVEQLEDRLCLCVFYDFSVIARTGDTTTTQDTINSLSSDTSINDSGRVAFIGNLSGPGPSGGTGSAVVVGDGGGSKPVLISFSTLSSTRLFAFPQITNDNLVVARDIGGGQFFFVRTWDSSNPGLWNDIVSTDPISPAYDFLFSSVTLPSRANDGGVAFVGLVGTQAGLYYHGFFNQLVTTLSGGGFRPMVGNGGNTVVADGTPTTSEIVLNGTAIASLTSGWDALGRAPGISDDGNTVAFYGELNSAGATAFGTTAGPGIFLSIGLPGGSRKLVRVTGGLTPDLGYDAVGTPINFSTYGIDSRVGVVHQELGAAGLTDDTFEVAFLGTPTSASVTNPQTQSPYFFSASQGLWTARVDALLPRSGSGSLLYNVTSAIPVIQVNDNVGGSVVTSLAIYDPIAVATRDESGTARTPQRGDHWIAFEVGTGSGAMIVRGAHLDSDADGLLDHWESDGIDVNQDGVVDLDLPAMGSQVNHRDLFLETDWLKGDPRDFSPQSEALEFLVNMFSAQGITVHVDVGIAHSINMGTDSHLLQGGDTISHPVTTDSIEVIYFGADGTQTFAGQTDNRWNFSRPVVSCSFKSIKDKYFATADLGARELAFHYVVFGDLASGSDPSADTFNNFQELANRAPSGLAELFFYRDWNDPTNPNLHGIPGNDLIVSLQGGRSFDSNGDGIPDVDDGTGTGTRVNVAQGFLQGHTLAHELGHNLGLLHGGVDNGVDGYGPPQYRSLMSYRYQMSPDAAGNFIDSYSSSGTGGSFDDWSYIRMDFSSYMDSLGNTLGKDRGTTSPQTAEMDVQDLVGPLDFFPPSVAITAPAPASSVTIGGSLTVTVAAADNLALARVMVSFDVDGNGMIEPGETVTATRIGPDAYQALFMGIGGAVGTREVTAIAVDSANFTASATITVSVQTTAVADLAITKSHTGNFRQGDIGDTYTITINNIGAGPTVGAVNVADLLPAGLTATAISGTGWTTNLAALTATRSDVLGAGASYAALTVTVNVAANAPPSVTNTVTVSGGGELNTANDTANDLTTIDPLVATTVSNVTSTLANGSYGVGTSIPITVTFSTPVTVTGTPRLALNTGGVASYSGGSNSSALTFTYIVAAGQNSSHLDYVSTAALTLNGGTIIGAGSMPAVLTLASPGAAGSLGANKNIVIDTLAPTIQHFNVMFGMKTYDLIGSTRYDLPWRITGIQVVFSEPIAQGDVSSLTGVTTTAFSGLGTNTLTWTINPLTQGVFAVNLLGSGPHALRDAALNSLYGGSGFAQNLKVLYGDVTGDGFVSAADLLAIFRAQSQPYNVFDDLNGDGVVDNNDVQLVRKRIGARLP